MEQLSLCIEDFVVRCRSTTVSKISKQFHISDGECLAELERLQAYGVRVSSNGEVLVPEEALAA